MPRENYPINCFGFPLEIYFDEKPKSGVHMIQVPSFTCRNVTVEPCYLELHIDEAGVSEVKRFGQQPHVMMNVSLGRGQ